MTTTPINPDRKVTLVDTTLRDGMSSVSHQFTTDNVAAIAAGLDRAGISTIEVAHGIGLGASSIQYGFAAATDPEYVRAAVGAVENADIAALYVPGIATLTELQGAIDAGITTVRVAVHCTEADCGQQPVEWAKDKGLNVMCFLMMSHRLEAEPLAEQAAKLDSYGADVVYSSTPPARWCRSRPVSGSPPCARRSRPTSASTPTTIWASESPTR